MNKLSKQILFWVFALTLSIGTYSSGFLSYTFQLSENRKIEEEGSIYRILELHINNQSVGRISYKIYPQNPKPSFIEILHVEKEQRQNHGYGKALLYQALQDIIHSGATHVELTRCPFDLPVHEQHALRDGHLKKFYGRFGFNELGSGTTMRLDVRKINPIAMISFFKDKDVQFDLHDQQHALAA